MSLVQVSNRQNKTSKVLCSQQGDPWQKVIMFINTGPGYWAGFKQPTPIIQYLARLMSACEYCPDIKMFSQTDLPVFEDSKQMGLGLYIWLLQYVEQDRVIWSSTQPPSQSWPQRKDLCLLLSSTITKQMRCILGREPLPHCTALLHPIQQYIIWHSSLKSVFAKLSIGKEYLESLNLKLVRSSKWCASHRCFSQ